MFACVLGRTTGPQQERGVYRTTDGGQHWDRVLFADEKTGCSGLSMDPQNPHTLFAGMWQVEMHTWAELSGGPGSGIWVSHDGGTTWKRIEGHGLPKSPLGKIDVAVAPTNSNRVYALIQTADQGSVWRSDDGGENWKAVNYQRALIGRAGYYIRLAVSPANENEVLVANSSFYQSLDGGMNFEEKHWGGDTHDIWFDPKNPDRFVITDDGGLNITTVHGRGFHRVSVADRADVPRRCRQPGSRTTSTATCRTTGTCAAPACRRAMARPDGTTAWAAANRVSPFLIHRSECGVGYLLRKQSYALGRALQEGALGEPVDDHARLAAQRCQVSLPLDFAAGHRSLRPRHRVLRLPGDLQNHPTPDKAGRSSVPTSRRKIRRTSFLRAASSAITWGSSTER